MKQFYFKEKNGELYFFYRDTRKNKEKTGYKKWTEMCDNKEIKRNNTFNELLGFLKIKQKIEHKIDEMIITIWISEKYKLIRIENNNQNLKENENSYLAKLGDVIYILKKLGGTENES
ncbi:hypothetical protein EII29_02565 [Leptotrichia sp. OH3620_COT-345]|uniref:hypothetical protein n=1 Tax=Leptotrichia sp. OH3620_COT-345 TaxID=2491048 RepID=UPI000F6549D9|nr:hypothetical protein [Leptotrichia sp. OH3620_COT-345]RRD40381.1 hypothetical protein EII29_02565 [Leptotrichia sp. OH3620_COT-345]